MKHSDDVSDNQGGEAAQIGGSAAEQHRPPDSNDGEPDIEEGLPEEAESESERTDTASTSDAVLTAAAVTEHRAEEVAEAAGASAEAATQVQNAAETVAAAAAKTKLEAEVAASVSSRDGIFALGIALAVVAAAVLAAVLGPDIFIHRRDNSDSMSIIAATERELPPGQQSTQQAFDQVWHIKGQVLFENSPAEGALVYAVLKDHRGNEYTSNVVKNTADGGFKIDLGLGKHHETRRPLVEEVLVVASLTYQDDGWIFDDDSTHRASAELRPELTSGSRWSRESAEPFLSALVIFGFSILLSMIPVSGLVWQASKYFSVALLGVIFTAWMLYFISVTMQTLGGSTRSDEVISLGFAHVFYGGYVEDANDEWILSLTTPEVRADLGPSLESAAMANVALGAPEEIISFLTSRRPAATDAPDQALDNARAMEPENEAPPSPVEDTVQSGRKVSSGFGAPLWLLLLSVVGASAFAIKMVLENLEKPEEFNDFHVRKRVAAILRHQFYILFAPLGAVFVYQLLVAAGSASEPITVGLAALASGIALSSVLERASQAVETATGRDRQASATMDRD